MKSSNFASHDQYKTKQPTYVSNWVICLNMLILISIKTSMTLSTNMLGVLSYTCIFYYS